jgi:hypothetical protein
MTVSVTSGKDSANRPNENSVSLSLLGHTGPSNLNVSRRDRPCHARACLREYLAGIVVLFCLTFLVNSSHASVFVGTTTDVIVQPSPTTPGAIRISIIVPNPPAPCPSIGAYAYEYSGTDLGKTWTALLLAAQTATRQVQIDGTGASDQYGVEVVSVLRLF